MSFADALKAGIPGNRTLRARRERTPSRPPLRLSYLKTVVLAMVAGVAAIALAHRFAVTQATMARLVLEGIGWSLGMGLECVAAGGCVAIIRDRRDLRSTRDLFLATNDARSERAVLAGRDGLRARFGRAFRRALGPGWPVVGEEVQIRSREEIATTLDADGRLDGLPFMPEMAEFCGQRARVFRCVDKVYDYGGQKTLRRLEGVVLLAGLRCNGSAHGNCQAGCYLLWKTAWLRPTGAVALRAGVPREDRRSVTEEAPRPDRYTCQLTQLAAMSTFMAPWDIRQDLRPLLAGNVTAIAFCIAMLTRIFKAAQRVRGGLGYPPMAQAYPRKTEATAPKLAPGDGVRVLPREHILATLDERGRNRGLWFDRDMLKHCGRRYTVLRRVHRIIDAKTGRMLQLKSPCIVLDGVDTSGEFLRFSPQHEYPFWRDAWLDPEPSSARESRL